MMVRVVMSSATRVPATNFSLSTLFRHPTTYRGPLLALTMTASVTYYITTASVTYCITAAALLTVIQSVPLHVM